MSRFYGNHPGTRQTRGFRNVKPATHEDQLASMQRELERRIEAFGEDDPFVQVQRNAIAKEEANGTITRVGNPRSVS